MNLPPLSVSKPTSGTGNRASMTVIASINHRGEPFFNATFSVHPVHTSVTVSEWVNSPSRVAPQVRDQVRIEGPGRLLVLIPGPTNLNRVAQQRVGLRPRQTRQPAAIPGGLQHPVNCRTRHLQQLRSGLMNQTHVIQLIMLLKLGQSDAHRRGQILSAGPASQTPHLDQQLHRVIPIRGASRGAFRRLGRTLPRFGGR